MATTVCYDIYGNAVPIASETITFRPAVYGIFIENSQILLQKQPQTGLWYPPGKILAANDTPTNGILRRLGFSATQSGIVFEKKWARVAC